MTITVHILSEGFVSPNGRAFLFPLIVHQQALLERDIKWKLFTNKDASVYDCDLLIIDSKYYRTRWISDTDGILNEIKDLTQKISRVFYFDTTDSSGWIQVELLDLVDRYYKSQLLVYRNLYQKSMYGNRPFSDYFHRTFGINDQRPEYSKPVIDPVLLNKLHVSWNSGLADYSLYGLYRMGLYMRIPLPGLLKFPTNFTPVRKQRSNDVQARMGISYSRESVSWQRKAVRKKLEKYFDTRKLSRKQYFRELKQSRVVVSPFGFGEITLKDFEVFLTGGLLLKPDMSSLETWPNLFRDGETMISHAWDLSDLEEKIHVVLENYDDYIDVAENGQSEYRAHMERKSGQQLFSDHFESIVKLPGE